MTLDGTLDERYLTWLVRQIEPVSNLNPARSHYLMMAEMFRKEFTWFIPNDDNRFYDGLDVRQEFVNEEEGGDVPGNWFAEPCSFLEMLIALARRMSFESTPLEPDYWFWQMLENLDLRSFKDDVWDDDIRIHIVDVLDRVMDRKYHADGKQGLFPLRHPRTDQREVEIWYQSQQYLMENINV